MARENSERGFLGAGGWEGLIFFFKEKMCFVCFGECLTGVLVRFLGVWGRFWEIFFF